MLLREEPAPRARRHALHCTRDQLLRGLDDARMVGDPPLADDPHWMQWDAVVPTVRSALASGASYDRAALPFDSIALDWSLGSLFVR